MIRFGALIGCLMASGTAAQGILVDSTSYYEQPLEKWSVQFSNSGSLNSGPNAATVSPDGSLVYVTLYDGNLEVLEAANGKSHSSFTPEPFGQRWSTICRTAVTFGTTSNGETYVIHSVIDVPPSSDTGSRQL